jgi:hypothetical protein
MLDGLIVRLVGVDDATDGATDDATDDATDGALMVPRWCHGWYA